jgi:hypothetical protein
MYSITERSKKIAKENNLIISPSKDGKHKIDVFDKSKNFITSIGGLGYKDYPTYLKEQGKEYADNRKKLYRIRHKKDLNTTRGKLSNLILWS